LTAFSQVDTAKNKIDSVKNVVLPFWMAKEVVKDLVRYDSISSELKTEKSKNQLLVFNDNLKDSLLISKDAEILEYKKRDSSLAKIDFLKDQRAETYKSGYEFAKDLYIKEKRTNKFFQVVIIVLTTTNLICLLSKH
jgi:hypothetical protein